VGELGTGKEKKRRRNGVGGSSEVSGGVVVD
jgi:hypothetical protein